MTGTIVGFESLVLVHIQRDDTEAELERKAPSEGLKVSR